MNMTVTNEKMTVGEVEVGDLLRSSIFLIGDTEVITCSSVFDTPADSLVFSPQIPLPRPSRPD